jgi:hypothetical protein
VLLALLYVECLAAGVSVCNLLPLSCMLAAIPIALQSCTNNAQH